MSTPPTSRRASGSLAVGAGILLSRLAGLVRQSVFAYFFGNSDAADVFSASFRIPNLLQNLFGEGALSASLIPVYARLRAQGREEDATRVASVVATILALATSLLVLAGVVATPWIIDAIAPGFEGAKREATIRVVRIFFPGAGLLVLSAWCLGILNSHRKFFLSYFAPVLWSAAIVVALVLFGPRESGYSLAEYVAWGSVAGSALQLFVQLPVVWALLGRLRPSLDAASEHVRQVFRNFAPVVVGRGVVQISAYVDQIIASFLPSGAIAALAYAQVVYTLPVSLFGMSVSAAELPEMASAVGSAEEVRAHLRLRLEVGLARIAFFIIPSVVALLFLGDLIAALLFQRGRFAHSDALYVWAILAGSTVGLLAATMGRLYASALYALGDTRTPLAFAVVRVALTSVLGYVAALVLPKLLEIDASWGTVGLSATAGVAGWVEFALLRRSAAKRVGATGVPGRALASLWLAALVAAAAGWGLKILLPKAGVSLTSIGALAVLLVFGLCYLAVTHGMGFEQAREIVALARGSRRSTS